MAITASLVAELRKATDCGMMDCKKALEACNGDTEKATKLLREKGLAKAAKAASRIAAEGVVIIKTADKKAVMLEVNCETDFVARDANFIAFANEIASASLEQTLKNLEVLQAFAEEKRKALIAKIGENIQIRRMHFMETSELIGTYVHSGRIGVLVAIKNGDRELAKDIAMHIAASKPVVVSPSQMPEHFIAAEREIFATQAAQSGKPAEIIKKMVEGRIHKFLNEMSLMGQPFVKNPEITVEKLLKSKQASVDHFIRFELGEGIEKPTENFAEAVMAQIKGTE